jgi:phage tail-like protein
VEIFTYADEQERRLDEILALPDHLWARAYIASGRMPKPGQSQVGPQTEFLVQSREGQYLWLRVRLKSDGYASPAVIAAAIHYPRNSYLEYLPAVFSADEESRWFLERFLSIFQTEWEAIEALITDMPRLFDPEAVPVGELMAYLASWLALPLEGSWSGEQQRRLLSAAPDYYPRRGTPDGLLAVARVYLQNITGQSNQDLQGYPVLIEGFRERQRLLLSAGDPSRLRTGAPLWSPQMVARLQLDEFSQTGEVRLVSTGDPQGDLFHEFAHQFRVFLPSVWLRTADDERMLRRALDTEKPAHTRYDLCLVEPRLRVGVQSTIGVDTILGEIPKARLACQAGEDAPPSRPPRYRLGYDTVLTGVPQAGPQIQLAPGTRVGKDTVFS